MTESPTTSTASAVTSDVLQSELDRAQTAVEGYAALILSEVVDAHVDGFRRLLGDWHANTRAHMEYLGRFLLRPHRTDRIQSELTRTERDLMRWMRQLTERTAGACHGSVTFDRLKGALYHVEELVDGAQTVSAPVTSRAFEALESDGWWMRKRKAKARRALPTGVRAVPMHRLMVREVVPRFTDDLVWVANMVGSLRFFYWRRLRLVANDIAELFNRADNEVDRGNALDAKKLETEMLIGIERLQQDVETFRADIVRRIEKRQTEALDGLASAAWRCDTFALPLSKLGPPLPDQSRLTRLQHTLKDHHGRWDTIARGTAEALATLLDGEAFLAAVRYAHHRDANRLDEILRDGVLERLKDIEGLARSAMKEMLDALRMTDLEAAADALKHQEDVLLSLIQGECGARVDETASNASHCEVLSDLQLSVRKAVRRVGAQFEVVLPAEVRIEEGAAPPQPVVHQLPFRSVAEAVVISKVEGRAREMDTEAAALISNVANELESMARVVSQNIEAAAAELQKGPDGRGLAKTFVERGMGIVITRARELALASSRDADRIVNEVSDSVSKALAEFEKHLRALDRAILDDGALQLQVAEERDEPRRQAVPPPERVDSVETLTRVMKRASFAARSDGIPDSYVRLFLRKETSGTSAHVAGGPELGDARAAVQRWRSGDPESIALVGLDGSGKGSLLTRIRDEVIAEYPSYMLPLGGRIRTEHELASYLARLLRLEEGISLEEIESNLLERNEKLAILIEDGELFFLRHPSGLHALRALVGLISATADQVLWVVSFENVSYEFLDAVLHLSDAFSTTIEVRPLQRSDIEEMVLARHRLSGLRLRFEGVADPGESPRERFFDDLAALSYGHPTLNMYFWLASLREINSRGELVVGPPRGLPTELLCPLEGRKLAALATLMLHGGLERHDFAYVMRVPVGEAAATLALLRHHHLVEIDRKRPGHHRVSRVAYRLVYDNLRRRSVL